MAIYTDTKGFAWELRISVPAMIKISRKLGLTLHAIIDWQSLCIADMIEAIPIIIDAQLRERKMTGEDFLSAVEPSQLPNLFQALGEAVRESFPQLSIKEGASDPLSAALQSGS